MIESARTRRSVKIERVEPWRASLATWSFSIVAHE
jgi:hypothetical protein